MEIHFSGTLLHLPEKTSSWLFFIGKSICQQHPRSSNPQLGARRLGNSSRTTIDVSLLPKWKIWSRPLWLLAGKSMKTGQRLLRGISYQWDIPVPMHRENVCYSSCPKRFTGCQWKSLLVAQPLNHFRHYSHLWRSSNQIFSSFARDGSAHVESMA